MLVVFSINIYNTTYLHHYQYQLLIKNCQVKIFLILIKIPGCKINDKY